TRCRQTLEVAAAESAAAEAVEPARCQSLVPARPPGSPVGTRACAAQEASLRAARRCSPTGLPAGRPAPSVRPTTEEASTRRRESWHVAAGAPTARATASRPRNEGDAPPCPDQLVQTEKNPPAAEKKPPTRPATTLSLPPKI